MIAITGLVQLSNLILVAITGGGEVAITGSTFLTGRHLYDYANGYAGEAGCLTLTGAWSRTRATR